MRAVVQRVREASVTISGEERSRIGHGLLVLLGIEVADTTEDLEWLCGKIARMRIFADEAGLMNRDINEVGGQLLLVSQFTLHANTAKGNRPSYIRAARPEQAIPLYEEAIERFEQLVTSGVRTGEFGAGMKVALINDGPVTIIIDSKQRE
ncbi:MAG: D-tyrosyl-tRNA(Tyr) deacylase [Flavobacteriales bacterium]|nr:MAG: D-tyrosyl-tRNA(Tyr) deacylase [Flavobacteriales bacterium]